MEPNNSSRKKAVIGLSLAALIGAFAFVNGGMMPQMHKTVGTHLHGADGTGHDEVNMPGLKGENASPEESEELAVMFRNFKTFTRNVTNLPNGIRTVTHSSDEIVMAKLESHVVGMITRVEQGDDPKIIIQSPTLDIFFQRSDSISSTIDVTDEGIIVTQTSDDPEIVAALQTHAAEVSDMAERGMVAVHEKMLRQTTN